MLVSPLHIGRNELMNIVLPARASGPVYLPAYHMFVLCCWHLKKKHVEYLFVAYSAAFECVISYF